MVTSNSRNWKILAVSVVLITVIFGCICMCCTLSLGLTYPSEVSYDSYYDHDVELVKSFYPELKKYPSSSLPPSYIDSTLGAAGRYLVFYTAGSGTGYVIDARCFIVTADNKVIPNGEYHYSPVQSSMPKYSLSPITCK